MIVGKLNVGSVSALSLNAGGRTKPGWSAPVGGSGMVPQPNNTALFFTGGEQVTLNEPARNSGTYTITANTTPEQVAAVTHSAYPMEGEKFGFNRGLWQYETDNGPMSGRWELRANDVAVATIVDAPGVVYEFDVPGGIAGQTAVLREVVTQGGIDYYEDLPTRQVYPLCDSFTHDDGYPVRYYTGETGIAWAESTGFEIFDGTARNVANGSAPHCVYRNQTLNDDQYFEGDLIVGTRTDSSDAGVMLMVRRSSTSSNNFYAAYYDHAGNMRIGVKSGGVWSVPHSQAVALTPGGRYRCRFEAQGSTLRVLIDGTEVMSVIDTTHASGAYAGIAGKTADLTAASNQITYVTGGNL